MYSPYNHSFTQKPINKSETNINFILVSDDRNIEIAKMSKNIVDPKEPWKNGKRTFIYYVRRGNDIEKIEMGSTENYIGLNDGGTRIYHLNGSKLVFPHNNPKFPGSQEYKFISFDGLHMNNISHMSQIMQSYIEK